MFNPHDTLGKAVTEDYIAILHVGSMELHSVLLVELEFIILRFSVWSLSVSYIPA